MQVMGYLWSERTEKRLFLHPHRKVGLELSGYGVRSEVQRQLGKLPVWAVGDRTNFFAKLARARPEEWGYFVCPFESFKL